MLIDDSNILNDVDAIIVIVGRHHDAEKEQRCYH